MFAQSDSDEESNVVILTGANRRSKWHFPNVTSCPNMHCDAVFENRSQCRRHYQKQHAMNFQYCTECKKPVCAHNLSKLKKHFEKMHPNVSLPNESSSDAEEDSLITLNGGDQITQWQLPKTVEKKCPAKNCHKEFGTRSDVLTHFEKRHTLDHFYCRHCDTIVFAQDQDDFDEHYRKVHANLETQINFDDSIDATLLPSTSKV